MPGGRIRRDEWDAVLENLGNRYQDGRVRIETHDRVTGENVVSHEMTLESVELDLEDEKHPRVNVVVRSGNKTIKHILYLPSRLALRYSNDGRTTSLDVDTVNTKTTVHFRATSD